MGSVDFRRGQVVGSTVVSDDGAIFTSPTWLVGYSPQDKDPVVVLVSGGTAFAAPSGLKLPDTGTIAGSAASGLVAVTAGATTYQCRYIGTAPGSGTLVALLWQGSTPWVLGTAAAVTAVPNPGDVPTAPLPTSSGTLNVAAIDSGSWRSIDGWGSVSSRPASLTTAAVVQGSYSAGLYSGAWFYGAQAAQLAGATITGLRVRLSPRLSIGSYNATLTAHLYAHTSSGKPAGDVTRTLGPNDQALPSGYGGGWVALSTTWAATLIGGGGIGIYGASGPYLGLLGIDKDPASGQLQIDWTR